MEKNFGESNSDKNGSNSEKVFFKKHPVIAAFLKAFVFFLVFFTVCEIGARVIVSRNLTTPKAEGGQEFKAHPALFWRLRSNLDMKIDMPGGGQFVVKTNSRGIRGAEVPFKKPPGGFRIECYGDSITYGHGVEGEKTYEMQLQSLLQERNFRKNIEVLNFGCPGYSSFQGWYLFNTLGTKYEPDLCVLAFCFADPSMEEKSDERRASGNAFTRFIQEFLYGSEFYLALRQAKIKLDGKEKPGGGGKKSGEARVSEDRYREIMKTWCDEMKKRKGKVIFLGLATVTPDPFENYGHYRKICRDMAAATGNYYIDMNEEFKKRGEDVGQFFLLRSEGGESRDRIHPNEQGFKIMAEAIASLIEKENLAGRGGE